MIEAKVAGWEQDIRFPSETKILANIRGLSSEMSTRVSVLEMLGRIQRIIDHLPSCHFGKKDVQAVNLALLNAKLANKDGNFSAAEEILRHALPVAVTFEPWCSKKPQRDPEPQPKPPKRHEIKRARRRRQARDRNGMAKVNREKVFAAT